MVGDPAQTIHSFAGAQAGYLTGFAGRFPDTTVIRLVRDYRSTPQVVGLANTITAQSAAGMGAVTLQAQQPAGPEVELTEAPDEAAEAAGVADWLARLASQGTSYREMAVLFRINAQSPAIEQALADRGIPYLVRGGERFYERPEVRQALLVLRTEARVATETDAVSAVKAVLGTLGWTEQPPDGAGAMRERWESLAALVSVAEDLAAEADPGEAPDPAAISAELDRRAEAQHVPTAQGVTVGTLHSAKGLEWDAVALLGIHEGSLPFVLASSPEQVNEERRLLYVGITRARRLLRVSWSRTRNGGGHVRKPSRFLGPVLPAAAPGAPGGAPTRRQPGHHAVGPLPVLRSSADRGRRTQGRPPSRLPGDIRRGNHEPASRVAPAGSGGAEAAGLLHLHRRHVDRAGGGTTGQRCGTGQDPGSRPGQGEQIWRAGARHSGRRDGSRGAIVSVAKIGGRNAELIAAEPRGGPGGSPLRIISFAPVAGAHLRWARTFVGHPTTMVTGTHMGEEGNFDGKTAI